MFALSNTGSFMEWTSTNASLQPIQFDPPLSNPNVTLPTSPPTRKPTRAPTVPTTQQPTQAPTEFPFATSAYTELPRAVNFSHRTDLHFDVTQGDSILVYDVQWVPTLGVLVVIISDRIVPKSRNPILLGVFSSIQQIRLSLNRPQ
jgi:hypothetical protein